MEPHGQYCGEDKVHKRWAPSLGLAQVDVSSGGPGPFWQHGGGCRRWLPGGPQEAIKPPEGAGGWRVQSFSARHPVSDENGRRPRLVSLTWLAGGVEGGNLTHTPAGGTEEGYSL